MVNSCWENLKSRKLDSLSIKDFKSRLCAFLKTKQTSSTTWSWWFRSEKHCPPFREGLTTTTIDTLLSKKEKEEKIYKFKILCLLIGGITPYRRKYCLYQQKSLLILEFPEMTPNTSKILLTTTRPKNNCQHSLLSVASGEYHANLNQNHFLAKQRYMYLEHVHAEYSPSFVIWLKMLSRINLTNKPRIVWSLGVTRFHSYKVQKQWSVWQVSQYLSNKGLSEAVKGPRIEWGLARLWLRLGLQSDLVRGRRDNYFIKYDNLNFDWQNTSGCYGESFVTGPEDIDRNTDIILALCRREGVEC